MLDQRMLSRQRGDTRPRAGDLIWYSLFDKTVSVVRPGPDGSACEPVLAGGSENHSAPFIRSFDDFRSLASTIAGHVGLNCTDFEPNNGPAGLWSARLCE